MSKDILIPADEFCASHNIEISFIRSLGEYGLIEIITVEEKGFIQSSQLQMLERIVRLHSDLEINLEGIESIFHLLEKMDKMQEEITALRNRLSLYEPGEYPLTD